MALTEQDKKDIRETLIKTLEEKHNDFWIEAEQHYLDHKQCQECQGYQEDWKKDHEFIKGWRESTGYVRKQSLRVAVGTVVATAVGWALWRLGIFKIF